MANYEINLTATQIEAALNKAHAPSTVVDTTQNLVESGAIKTYVDNQVSAGASITTESFAGSALEDSEDGLTTTDTAIPTSAAVQDYVESVTPTMASWANPSNIQTNFRRATASGTAASDGFLIASATGADSEEDGTIAITVAGRTFRSYYNNNDYGTVTVPIRKNESYSISVQESVSIQMLFRALT